MPRVTALREERRGIAIELDGAAWRTLPVDVVARAGLIAGLELDRPRLRKLARELRRSRALVRAGRILQARDHSTGSLALRLERAGIRARERAEAVDTLVRVGIVDDARFAVARAAALADRGYGDEAVRFDLERNGVGAELVEDALAALEPEVGRAERLIARRGRSAATARFLARRGFGEDAVELGLDPRP